MQGVSEAVIKHEAEILYLNGADLAEVTKSINATFEKKYPLKVVQRWCEVEKWSEAKNQSLAIKKKDEIKIPAFELIQKEQYDKALHLQKMVFESINEQKASGESLDPKLLNVALDSIRTIVKIADRQIIGNSGNEITNIIMNFNAVMKESEIKEVIDAN